VAGVLVRPVDVDDRPDHDQEEDHGAADEQHRRPAGALFREVLGLLGVLSGLLEVATVEELDRVVECVLGVLAGVLGARLYRRVDGLPGGLAVVGELLDGPGVGLLDAALDLLLDR